MSKAENAKPDKQKARKPGSDKSGTDKAIPVNVVHKTPKMSEPETANENKPEQRVRKTRQTTPKTQVFLNILIEDGDYTEALERDEDSTGNAPKGLFSRLFR